MHLGSLVCYPLTALFCGVDLSAWLKITSLNFYCWVVSPKYFSEISCITTTKGVLNEATGLTLMSLFLLTIAVTIWRCILDNYSLAVWASWPQHKHYAIKWVARHTVTFSDISNNPENSKKTSISLKYSPSPSISFPPAHLPRLLERNWSTTSGQRYYLLLSGPGPWSTALS